jgi:hypothetical protein
MGHLPVRIMPVHERGLRQMATRVIEHSITHILPVLRGQTVATRERYECPQGGRFVLASELPA